MYTQHPAIKDLRDIDCAFVHSLPDYYRANWTEIRLVLADAYDYYDSPVGTMSLSEYFVMNLALTHILSATTGEDARKAFNVFTKRHDYLKQRFESGAEEPSRGCRKDIKNLAEHTLGLIYHKNGFRQSSLLLMQPIIILKYKCEAILLDFS